jgi:hypothetical protein
MMKKIALLIVWFCGLTGVVSAQTFTNTRILKQAAVGYKLAFNANYAKAMAMARQKGWELVITSRGGRKGVLVGVDELGSLNIISPITIPLQQPLHVPTSYGRVAEQV